MKWSEPASRERFQRALAQAQKTWEQLWHPEQPVARTRAPRQAHPWHGRSLVRLCRW